MKHLRTHLFAAAAMSVLLLAGCSSGGIGDVLGGGSSPSTTAQLSGTVDSVDTSSQSILLTNVNSNGSYLGGGSSSSGSSVRVYYDSQTTVQYQGQSYRPTDLERGDKVTVAYQNSNGRLVADSMTVTYNAANGTGNGTGGGTYNTNITGTVQYVDNTRRTIQVDRGTYSGGGQMVLVEFDTNTPVYYNNQTYRPADLDVGDQVDVTVRDMGNGRYVAQQINVTRSAGATSTATSDLRGTVRSVDTASRTITLEQTTWGSRFTTGTTSSVVTVQYDSNTWVDYQGGSYSPTNLERGDVVSVQVRNVGSSQYLAQRITLVSNVRNR